MAPKIPFDTQKLVRCRRLLMQYDNRVNDPTSNLTASEMIKKLLVFLKAIDSNGHRRMKTNQFIIEHLVILRVVVVSCNISE